ncbi:MAG: ribosome maturation factor RimP [Actinomycetota bacterium]
MSALDEVTDLAAAVTRRRSLRLWDVELSGQKGRTVVRVFVDADDGVDLDTVADVSGEISRALDLRDPIEGRYILEVSSPGLERNLRSPEHFRLCVGRSVVVKTKDLLVGESHRIDGVVVDAGRESVRLSTAGGEVEVPYQEIKSARTVFEWK